MTSKIKLRGDLNRARVARRVDLSRRANRRGGDRFTGTGRRNPIVDPIVRAAAQLRVVEGIKRLAAQLESHALRDVEILEERNIPVVDSRATQNIAPRVTHRSVERACKCERVVPLLPRLLRR